MYVRCQFILFCCTVLQRLLKIFKWQEEWDGRLRWVLWVSPLKFDQEITSIVLNLKYSLKMKFHAFLIELNADCSTSLGVYFLWCLASVYPLSQLLFLDKKFKDFLQKFNWRYQSPSNHFHINLIFGLMFTFMVSFRSPVTLLENQQN